MLIIDPEKDFARIYTENYAGIIKGNPKEVCEEIISRLLCYDYYGVKTQIAIPSIVRNGVGDLYIDVLKGKDVKVKEISPKYISVFLPKLI